MFAKCSRRSACALLAFGVLAVAQEVKQTVSSRPRTAATPPSASNSRPPASVRNSYVLGPDDQVTVRIVEAENIGKDPYRIDMDGDLRLPMIGRVRAGGRTVEGLEAELVGRFRTFIQEPDITVTITEFRSQPVSILGAVKAPGVYQLQGRRTLVEALSLAGGMDQTAGSCVKITRNLSSGPIPLKSALTDPTGEFSVAEVSVKGILEARNPEENILIRTGDVISVPRAELIYVTGQVQKSGGFVLNERETITVLQALSLAGGIDHAASPQNARIMRRGAAADRSEIPVDLRKILEGKVKDVNMQPEDILFIPSSTPKKAAMRAVEAAIQLGTGLVIWRR